jgi:DNA-directed RNA polymerase subunit beta
VGGAGAGLRGQDPVFQGASEDEIGALLRLAGAHWARQALGITAEPPTFDVHDARQVAEAVQAAELKAGIEPRPEMGIGRAIDRIVGAAATAGELAPKLAALGVYLVAAGRELAERKESTLEAEFPAAAALLTAKGGEGLNAALEEHMLRAGLTPGGKVWMRDGRSGATFKSPVSVGAIYMLKLSHLVDDKIHARLHRAVLAGDAAAAGRQGAVRRPALRRDGGVGAGGVRRRAHAAGILTVKSDDVNGRSRVYEAIVKGENLPEPGLPGVVQRAGEGAAGAGHFGDARELNSGERGTGNGERGNNGRPEQHVVWL